MKKIITLFCFCLAILTSASAQKIKWQNMLGGSMTDLYNFVTPTPDNGFIVGGSSTSNISIDKTENCIGGYDYWILKLNAAGAVQWQNTIGGSQYDLLYAVSPTSDGGYICGGYSESDISGDKTENSKGLNDYWIIKLNAAGAIEWQKTIGGNGDDFFDALHQTPDGGYICGGCSNSGISGDKTEASMGSFDYWILKLDSIGTIQWQNTIGGNDDDCMTSLEIVPGGGYIMAGYSSSNASGDKTENSMGQIDFWVVKVNASGTLEWENTIGGSDDDFPESVIPTLDGGYICGSLSYSNASGDKTENSQGDADGWMVKLDPSGTIQWQNTIGGSDADYIECVVQQPNGDYVFGGTSRSNISGDKLENSIGSNDYWVVRTDNYGIPLWQNSFGGSTVEYLSSFAIDPNGGYICSGYSNSNISGDINSNSVGGNDFWVVKLDETANIICGELYYDENSNAVRDPGELPLSNRRLTEQNTGAISFSHPGGTYNLGVPDSGNYMVAPPSLSYMASVPASHSVYFSGTLQSDSLNDFAFQPTGTVSDLCISLTPVSVFRSGFNATYTITCENFGTVAIAPVIIFLPDNNMSYVGSSVTPSQVTTDSVLWTLPLLLPTESANITLIVHLDPGLPIGTMINPSVKLGPVPGDVNIGCNADSWEAPTIGSYDPNEILVSEDTLTMSQISNPPYLDYIVFFQNTGNDTAFNVKVLNTVDSNDVNPETFEFISSSHPVVVEYMPWQRSFVYTFSNILLPDSNVDEPGSHGFIRYRIKPRNTLSAGDTIKSTAYIYFDFNDPVQTNTAMTWIVNMTAISVSGSPADDFSVFPNPAREVISFSSHLEIETAEIYNLMGEKVMTLHPGSDFDEVNIQHLVPGLYAVLLVTGKGSVSIPFVKE
jgi:hypothetical protein